MDRALRERIIGAVVLVVFAILVVPIFLNGPSERGEMITESVTLPGQNKQEMKQQTIVLERDRTEPVPSTATSAAVVQNTARPMQQSVVQVAAEKPAAKEETNTSPLPAQTAKASVPEPPQAKSATSSTGMWAVQLGSFSNQQNAERLAADLRNQGYAAFLSQLQTDSGSLHRVRIGPQKNRESAEDVAKQLRTGGHKGQVVPHP